MDLFFFPSLFCGYSKGKYIIASFLFRAKEDNTLSLFLFLLFYIPHLTHQSTHIHQTKVSRPNILFILYNSMNASKCCKLLLKNRFSNSFISLSCLPFFSRLFLAHHRFTFRFFILHEGRRLTK